MSIMLPDSGQIALHRAATIGLLLLLAPLLASCTTYCKPFALPDDMTGPGKPASMYSYAHDAKGKPFDLEPGEARGVYRTAKGTILSVFLCTQSDGNSFRERWCVMDMTPYDLPTHSNYVDESEYNISTDVFSSPAHIQTYVDKQKISNMLRIDIDGETIEVSIRDLYTWRLNKVRKGGYHTKINGTDYLFMTAKTDPATAGLIFFRQRDVIQGNSFAKPEYSVSTTRKSGAFAKSYPIGNSGAFIKKDQNGFYIDNGLGFQSAQAANVSGDAVYENNKAGVVKINADGKLGTGFLVAPDLVVTNQHVIEGANQISVATHDGRILAARILGGDPTLDLALLRLSKNLTNMTPLQFSNTTPIVGKTTYIIGHPAGAEWSLTAGTISAMRNVNGSPRFIQTDAAVNPGNSGGPMFNDQGYVIGVVVSRLEKTSEGREVQNIGYAIPAEIAMQFINAHK